MQSHIFNTNVVGFPVICSRTPSIYMLLLLYTIILACLLSPHSLIRSLSQSSIKISHSLCILFCFRLFIDITYTYTLTDCCYFRALCVRVFVHSERNRTLVVRVQRDRLHVRILQKYSSKLFSQSLTFDTLKRILKNGTRCARAFTHT